MYEPPIALAADGQLNGRVVDERIPGAMDEIGEHRLILPVVRAG